VLAGHAPAADVGIAFASTSITFSSPTSIGSGDASCTWPSAPAAAAASVASPPPSMPTSRDTHIFTASVATPSRHAAAHTNPAAMVVPCCSSYLALPTLPSADGSLSMSCAIRSAVACADKAVVATPNSRAARERTVIFTWERNSRSRAGLAA
jgi:hypothetical protein